MARDDSKYYRVLEYIEANLQFSLDIETLSEIAHLSKFHFHRQCSAFFKMPVSTLIKLLRLKQAAYQLAYRKETKIIEIAMDCGFESHEAFSRAFKEIFEKSPSDFRRSPDWIPWQEIYQPIQQLRINKMNAVTNYEVKIVEFPEIKLAVMEHKGPPQMLGHSIRRFIEWRKDNSPPSKSRTFNLVYDDPESVEPSLHRFDIACAFNGNLENNAYGLVAKKIPAGKCAVIRHQGSDDGIGAILNYLYTRWLPESEFEVRDFPTFFERVNLFPNMPESEMITDVCLPIE